jgi:hypothetical protein
MPLLRSFITHYNIVSKTLQHSLFVNHHSPNPASSDVTFEYIAYGANSGYLMIVNTVTGNSYNYIIDVNQTTMAVNIANFSSGLYTVVLICDGQVQNSKTLAKQ